MLKNIAVVGMTFETNSETISGGMYTVATPPSEKCKAENKFIYRGEVTINVTGLVVGAFVQTFPATASFTLTPPENRKTKCDNLIVLLEDDESNSIASMTFTDPMGNTIMVSDVKIKIVDGGTTRTKADDGVAT